MPPRYCGLQRAFISIALLLMLTTVNLCQARVADQPDSDENHNPRADAYTRRSSKETPRRAHQAIISVEDVALCDDANISASTLHRICRKPRTPLTLR
jgi:hypothetical protein